MRGSTHRWPVNEVNVLSLLSLDRFSSPFCCFSMTPAVASGNIACCSLLAVPPLDRLKTMASSFRKRIGNLNNIAREHVKDILPEWKETQKQNEGKAKKDE